MSFTAQTSDLAELAQVGFSAKVPTANWPMDLRSRYEQVVRSLNERAAKMRHERASVETIARAMHEERRRLASFFKDLTPEPHRTLVYQRTVMVYGSELGPCIEFLRARGKSWEAIIESATRPGPPLAFGTEPVEPE